MTNFERIKNIAMNEYALAEFLADIGDRCSTGRRCNNCDECVLSKCFNCGDYDEVREWLESEVDNNDP